ncbi:MAG TPA: hypoxanthine phosphoribosyltransferase [bacterium]|nr:hypoxanthine phosphoribosyltransferase [bacterium]
MRSKEIEILFSEDAIGRRLDELARDIEADFPDGDLVVVGVLKGSFIFMADLVRRIRRPLSCDFVRVSSYEHDRDTGVVRMEFDMTQPVEGKNVLLVEDIVDSGKTLRHLRRHIEAKEPAKMKVATLLYKGTPTNSRSLVDYVGFDSPHKYVIGYGLDSEGLYRSLPYVGAFK